MPSIEDFNQLATSLVIQERTGDKRTLMLRARALPYRPFLLDGSQREDIDWYTGNPIGVLQVYGAKEEPTTMNGWWKDVFLGETGHDPYATLNGTQLSTAIDLAGVVDDMRRKGQEIVLTWLNHTRYGIIKRFTQKWHTGHDVEYELMFDWISQEDVSLSQVPFTNSVATSDFGDAPNQIQAQVDQLDTGASNFDTAFDPSVEDAVTAVDQAGATIQSLTDDLTDAVVQIAVATTTALESQQRIAGILDGIKLEAADMRDLLGSTVDGARLNLGGGFGDVLLDRSSVRQQSDVADTTAALAAAQQRQVVTAMTGQVLAVFQAREGDDLRRVSMEFYGTPDDWQGLMIYNGLDDDVLSAGQIVIVPVSLQAVSS